jgi:hypothetical protein
MKCTPWGSQPSSGAVPQIAKAGVHLSSCLLIEKEKTTLKERVLRHLPMSCSPLSTPRTGRNPICGPVA